MWEGRRRARGVLLSKVGGKNCVCLCRGGSRDI
jgi:hypothetical protein